MRDWLTYQLSDFLLFSETVYWRLFFLENAALWPMPLVAPFMVLFALAVYFRRPSTGQQALAVFLAAAWAWVGWHFIWLRYAPINWAMVYFAPLCAVQVVAFALVVLNKPPQSDPGPRNSRFGFGLVLAATVAYPGLAILNQRPISSAEVIGIAPDPTAVASLGAAFLMTKGWHRYVIIAVSVLWLSQSALTLFVLDEPTALAPAFVLAVVFLRLLLSRGPLAAGR